MKIPSDEAVLASNREQIEQVGRNPHPTRTLDQAVMAHYLDRPEQVDDESFMDYDEAFTDWLYDLDMIVGQYL